MKWISRVFVFTAAFVVATFAASLFASEKLPVAEAVPPVVTTFEAPFKSKRHSCDRSVRAFEAKDVVGTWTGTWGHNDGIATIEIDSVKGDAFSGTLRKGGAVVRFEGTYDRDARRIQFDETKVVRLGAEMTEWSLGHNTATISPDARTLEGTGHDKWGQYAWTVSSH